MRLICPNCGAQYEVDESVIPDGGRDVQCSNCGHAWFQLSAKHLKAEAEEAAQAPDPVPEPALDPVAPPEPPAEPEPAPEPEPAAVAAEPEADATSGRPRRTLDDAVRNVLREEAERETRARVAEGSTVETQPELGLAAAIGAAAATTGGRASATLATATATATEARVATDDDAHDFDEDALVSRASRRELLPDIEEINSTLRATSERGGDAAAIDAPETLARRRSGFRMGFTTAILVAAILLALYVLAPGLARSVPALEPALTSYVATVDAGRLWLDGRMRAVTESLQSQD